MAYVPPDALTADMVAAFAGSIRYDQTSTRDKRDSIRFEKCYWVRTDEVRLDWIRLD